MFVAGHVHKSGNMLGPESCTVWSLKFAPISMEWSERCLPQSIDEREKNQDLEAPENHPPVSSNMIKHG